MLKETYPETKFSVRRFKYPGGSSLYIKWMDGPTNDEAKAKVSHFEGVDFITTNRSYSEAMLRAAAEKEAAKFGMATPEILTSTYDGGSAYIKRQTHQSNDCGSRWTLEAHIRRVIEGRDY